MCGWMTLMPATSAMAGTTYGSTVRNSMNGARLRAAEVHPDGGGQQQAQRQRRRCRWPACALSASAVRKSGSSNALVMPSSDHLSNSVDQPSLHDRHVLQREAGHRQQRQRGRRSQQRSGRGWARCRRADGAADASRSVGRRSRSVGTTAAHDCLPPFRPLAQHPVQPIATAMMMIIHEASEKPHGVLTGVHVAPQEERQRSDTMRDVSVSACGRGVRAERVGEQQQEPAEHRRRQHRQADPAPVRPVGAAEVRRWPRATTPSGRRWPAA